jgi:hypothetical protein
MSAPPLSKLIRFLLLAAGLIILLSVLWSFVATQYNDFLTGVAKSVVSKGVTVEQREGTIYFLRIEYQGSLQREVKDWLVASAIQFGLLLTVALVAATPGLALRRRLLYSGIAAALTFTLQIIAVVVMAKTFSSLFFVIVSDLFPPLLWALFSLRYWFPQQVTAPSHPLESHPSPKKQHK